MSKVLHVTSSRFFGGPERQMLGLARALRPRVDTHFASFSEGGLNRAFLDEVRKAGFPGIGLKRDTPRLIAASREIERLLREQRFDVLICHGYKAVTVGWHSARRVGVPTVGVSRGWTGEDRKIRVYERLDQLMLRRMQRVVCVSRAQAAAVQAAGVPAERITVIHNSVETDRFGSVDPRHRQTLVELFAPAEQAAIKTIVGAAGRLSPEKGFDVLIEAARKVVAENQGVGFVLFGDGRLRDQLAQQVKKLDIERRFILAGFSDELDRLMANLDLFVQSSSTEGLPNVLLEALAAGVPIIATDVGGTSEVLGDGRYGCLVPASDSGRLSEAILQALARPGVIAEVARLGKRWVETDFSFSHQAELYREIFGRLGDRAES